MDGVSHAVILDRRTPTNYFSTTVMHSNVGMDIILMVSEEQNNVITLKSNLVDEVYVTSIEPLYLPNIPREATIQCIHCVNLSTTELDDFTIGLTYVIGEEEDKNIEKYLNIYSGSPGSSLKAIDTCKTLKLDFLPFLLNHAIYMSETVKKGIWLLSGSDQKIHAYKTDGQQICEQNIEEYFVEFKDKKESICLGFDTKAFNGYKKRVSFYGGAIRKSILSLVNAEKNEILHTFVEYYRSAITTVQLFNVYNRAIKLDEIKSDSYLDSIPDNHSVDENQQVCLLVGTFECTMVYNINVLENKIVSSTTLVEIGRDQTVMTSLIKDINFDSKNEIILGTRERHILSYEFKDNTWVELQSFDIRYPVYTISYLDLTGEGVKDAVVLTTKGVHILKHEPNDIMQLIASHDDRHYRHHKGTTRKGFYHSIVMPQSFNNCGSTKCNTKK